MPRASNSYTEPLVATVAPVARPAIPVERVQPFVVSQVIDTPPPEVIPSTGSSNENTQPVPEVTPVEVPESQQDNLAKPHITTDGQAPSHTSPTAPDGYSTPPEVAPEQSSG